MPLASTPEAGDALSGDVAAFLKQVLAGAGKAAEPVAETAAEKPAATDAPAKPAPADPTDVRPWLADIDARFRAMEAQEKAAAESKAKESLAKRVHEFLKDGDLAKAKEALAELDRMHLSKLAEKDKALQDAQSRLQTTTVKTALSEAVTASGVVWASGPAGKQALKLLEDQVEVASDGLVREKSTGRPLEELLKASLASEDFDHLIAATHRKGGLGKGDSANAGPKWGQKLDPMEAVKLRIEEQKKAAKAAGLAPTNSWPGSRTAV